MNVKPGTSAVLTYGPDSLPGKVAAVKRFEHGPRAGQIWKIAVEIEGGHRAWYLRSRGQWLSIGGHSTATLVH